MNNMEAEKKSDITAILVPLPIITDRLIIRDVRPGDGEAIHQAKIESYDALKKWMPWAKTPGTLEEAEKLAFDAQEKFKAREDIMLIGVEREGERLVLSTGLHRMNWDLRIFEIGYWVRSSASGKGYATEGTNALIRYAFNALAASKISICHAAGNDASARVIEKLGFEKEGVFRKDARLPDGTVTDHHWYARFNDQKLPPLCVRW